MTAHDPTPAASAGTPLLWSNHRIGNLVRSIARPDSLTPYMAEDVIGIVRKVRDEMQAELDALHAANAKLKAGHDGAWDEVERYHALMLDMEQELVELRAKLQEMQAWQPITDDIVHTDGPEVIYVKDQLLNILGEHYVYLQQGYALCRLVPASQPTSAPKGFPANAQEIV